MRTKLIRKSSKTADIIELGYFNSSGDERKCLIPGCIHKPYKKAGSTEHLREHLRLGDDVHKKAYEYFQHGEKFEILLKGEIKGQGKMDSFVEKGNVKQFKQS